MEGGTWGASTDPGARSDSPDPLPGDEELPHAPDRPGARDRRMSARPAPGVASPTAAPR
jgi:hypothetical protein